MSEQLFPIIPERRSDKQIEPHPMSVPWSIAEIAYSVYAKRYGTSQSLKRLAERGGFHAGEMDDMLPDWRERVSDLTAANARIAELEKLLERWLIEVGEQQNMASDFALWTETESAIGRNGNGEL